VRATVAVAALIRRPEGTPAFMNQRCAENRLLGEGRCDVPAALQLDAASGAFPAADQGDTARVAFAVEIGPIIRNSARPRRATS